MSPKAFDLLALLIANRPAVVDKESLRQHLWPGTNVVDANLNNLVAEIRSVLDDDAQSPQFLRTVHRVGFAFCGQVTGDRSARTAQPDRKARAWLVWKERTIAIEGSDPILGRDPDCQIWIDAPGVSRKHARLLTGGDAMVLEDLGSTNGTFVGDRRLRQPVSLKDGQVIRMGEATLTFRSGASVDAPTRKIKRR